MYYPERYFLRIFVGFVSGSIGLGLWWSVGKLITWIWP